MFRYITFLLSLPCGYFVIFFITRLGVVDYGISSGFGCGSFDSSAILLIPYNTEWIVVRWYPYSPAPRETMPNSIMKFKLASRLGISVIMKKYVRIGKYRSADIYHLSAFTGSTLYSRPMTSLSIDDAIFGRIISFYHGV